MAIFCEPWHVQAKACLRQLADKEFQRKVWVLGEGLEISSYSEVVSQLFDDTGLGDCLENGKIFFGPEIDHVLSELSGALDRIDGSQEASRIIGSGEWAKVLRLAQRALAQLESLEQTSNQPVGIRST